MSVESINSRPPPTQSPLTAATIGFEYGSFFRQRVVDHPRHFRPGRQIAADIGADGKGSLTGAGQDDAAAIAVALQLVPAASELDQHLSRQGVEARLVVNGDDRDVPAMPG